MALSDCVIDPVPPAPGWKVLTKKSVVLLDKTYIYVRDGSTVAPARWRAYSDATGPAELERDRQMFADIIALNFPTT